LEEVGLAEADLVGSVEDKAKEVAREADSERASQR
jgi:hypothetical protein